MSVQLTDELRVLVEAEVASAIENMRKLDDSVEKTEKNTNKLDDALKSLEKKALVLSAAVAGAGGAAVKFAADNEKLRTSLEVLLGSAEQAGSVFEEWKRFGATTPLSVEEIASAGKSLLAFGIDAEEVTDTMRRLGDVAQGIGARLGDVADIYGKARVQGRLFSNDINQFQGRGIPIVQALAKELGTTEGAIKEMVAQGKIGFPELEKAFKAMTENGGQFEGMMDRLSQTTSGKFSTAMDNAQQAAASFGELLLPLVNDVLDSVSGLMDGIANMDAGTKRFVLGMGGVIAISGPVIAAINGIKAAVVAMNPVMAGIALAVVGIGAAAGFINQQAHAYEDLNNKIRETKTAAEGLLSSYAAGNDAKLLDKKTTDDLIKLYPELSKQIRAYKTSVKDAADAVKALSEQEILNAASSQLKRWNNLLETQLQAKAQARALREKLGEERIRNPQGFDPEVKQFYKFEGDAANATRSMTEIAAAINEQVSSIGKRFFNGALIDVPVKVNPVVNGESDKGNSYVPDPKATPAAKKRWQEWYSEITKTDIAAVNKIRGQGEALGNLFVESLDSGMAQSRQLAETLGKEFDVVGALRSQRDGIERALTELLSINPSEIDDPLGFADKFINPLAERFKKVSADIRDADFAKEVEELNKKIKEVGMSAGELAERAALLKGYTAEQAAEIKELAERYADLQKKSEKSLTSLEDVFGSILEKHTSLS
ncbi:MAG: phage tail tape measure protein, partial [Treponema sp.]|nr:phage tail tape measure protein [Treponema sp.]